MKLNKFLGGKIFYFIAFFCLSALSIKANNFSTISGYVFDIETNKPVENVEVLVVEKQMHTTTNNKGYFVFNCDGNATVRIKFTHLAYQENVITVDKNRTENKVFYLTPKIVEYAPVLVSGSNSKNIFDDIQDVSGVLKGKELDKDLGITLAATLKNETGISLRTMGPAPARPVFRGLGGDRIVISENGIKTNDLSATSPDHAVTIEPFTIDKVEVIRGPKVLLQSSTTIGGVINIIRDDIPKSIHNSPFGTLGVFGETANKGYLGAIKFEYPIAPFSLYLEGSRRKADNMNSANGELKNSYSNNSNYAFGGSFISDNFMAGISFRNYELSYGIPGGFVGAHPFGVNIDGSRREINSEAEYKFDEKNILNFELNYSAYKHDEYEHGGLVGAEFKVADLIGKLNYSHNKLLFFDGGEIGVSNEFRNFNVGGYVFTSPAKSYKVASYIYEYFEYKRFNFEIAGRLDIDNINPEYAGKDSKIGKITKRNFNTWSFSATSLFRLTDVVYLGSNISRSSRIPTIEELYSQGPHLAAYSYEVGNPKLEDEKGWGFELFLYHKFEKMFFTLTYFSNWLNYYIIPRNTGEINYATFLPIYESQGVKARIYGFEMQLDFKIIEQWELNLSGSFSRGKNITDGLNLPQIPPLKGNIGLKYSYDDFIIGSGLEFALKQDEVDLFETGTAGYAVWNAFAQYSFQFNGYINNISLSVDNILNQEYRNHLSRVKSIMPETGVNLRGTYRIYFHI